MFQLAVVALLAIAVSVGAGQVYAKKPDPGTIPCPVPENCDCITFIYAPVICHGDCIYSNLCLAHCAGAKGCQPLYH
jgi:hypothetical protein